MTSETEFYDVSLLKDKTFFFVIEERDKGKEEFKKKLKELEDNDN